MYIEDLIILLFLIIEPDRQFFLDQQNKQVVENKPQTFKKDTAIKYTEPLPLYNNNQTIVSGNRLNF